MNLIKVLGGVIVIGLILVVLVAGYLGFVPVVSDLMGTNKPRDLGVKYSQADYSSGLAKVPGLSLQNPAGACVTCNYTSTGSIPVKTAFTQEEFTAMMNAENSSKGPLRDMQFKFNSDGSVEASGMIIDPKITGPLYLKGKIVSASGKSATLLVDSAELGRLPLSDDQKKMAEDYANQAVGAYFNKNPGSSINSLSIGDGKINFDGSLPQNVVGEAN